MFIQFIEDINSHLIIFFGDYNKGNVLGLGKITIMKDSIFGRVMVVQPLSYNLLSINQLCHVGYIYLFSYVNVTIFRRDNRQVIFVGHIEGVLLGIYLVDFLCVNKQS